VTPEAEENGKDSSGEDNSKFISNGISNGVSKPNDDNKSDNPNALICLDEAEAAAEHLDGFTLDDLNDEVSIFFYFFLFTFCLTIWSRFSPSLFPNFFTFVYLFISFAVIDLSNVCPK
jgi:hypothetical protein